MAETLQERLGGILGRGKKPAKVAKAKSKASASSVANMSSFELKFMKMQFGSKARMGLYEKLSQFLKNGVSLVQALDQIYEFESDDGRKPKALMAVIVDDMRGKIRNGKMFAEAMKNWAPEGDIPILDAGEQGNALASALDNAVFVQQASGRIRGAVMGGVIYPAFLLCIIGLYLWIFGTQVVPAFDEVLPREKWTGAGAQMALLSDFVQYAMIPTVIGLITLAIVISATMPRWTGPLRAKFDKFPPWSVYRLSVGAGFLISFGALNKAGVTQANALGIIIRSASPWYRERLIPARRAILNGADIGEALKGTKLDFPDKKMISDLRAYSQLSNFDEQLDRLGRQWLDEAVARIQAQAAIMRNAAIVLLAGVLMWIGAGIFNLQGQITSAVS